MAARKPPRTHRLLALAPNAAGLTRSELEDRFLELIHRHALPAPETNHRLLDYEVDFLWPTARLVVEADGHPYHTTPQAFERDRRRDARLKLAGYDVVRFTYRQVTQEPDETAATVRQLLDRAPPPGAPRR